jgi:hypothetical protein
MNPATGRASSQLITLKLLQRCLADSRRVKLDCRRPRSGQGREKQVAIDVQTAIERERANCC